MKLFLFLCLFIPCAVLAQSAKISGKITSGNRPDAGTKVYILKADEGAKAIYDTINNFLTAKIYRGLYDDSIIAYNANKKLADGYAGKKRFKEDYEAAKAVSDKEKELVEDYMAKVQATGATTKEKFDNLDKHTSTAVSKAKYYPGNTTVTVDDSGSYSAGLNAGTYVVLIISNNRTGISTAEINGRLFIQQVELGENDSKTVSTKFNGN